MPDLMETAQRFSLGTLVSGTRTTAPTEVDIRVSGRGVFCELVMEFSFAADDSSAGGLFTVDRPWNAALTAISLNQDPIGKVGSLEQPVSLPSGLKVAAEEALQEGISEAISCFIPAEKSLRTLTYTFVIACDVLWHRSALAFKATGGNTQVKVDFDWDLGGLPGAQLVCAEAASDGRFANLDGSKRKWQDELKVARGEEFAVVLSLDEKKAASLCLYSEGENGGCGAVVVVAPVRPQLVRKPVKLAVVVEIRNPQEGLLTRELVDKLSSNLKPDDQIGIWFMGSSVTRQVMPWTDAGGVTEENLAQVLDPSFMGRTQYFWESFQRVQSECQDATHVVISSPGPKDRMPEGVQTRQPVFALATGRKPNLSTLGDLTGASGGCLSEKCIDGIDSFLKRVIIRLSAPLLKDFRLEGWGLDKVTPSGPTQVYTDRPTLVMGLYQGLLPQTVTLGGLSPAGQKLAQRVRVEKFDRFQLKPLFERQAALKVIGGQAVSAAWGDDSLCFVEYSRPVEVSAVFAVEPESGASSDTLAPPSIDVISTAVTLDDGMLVGSPDAGETFGGGDEFFAGADDQTIGDDFFASAESEDSADDFFNQPSSPSVENFFADGRSTEGPSFLDNEPATQKSAITADEDDGLPRIAVTADSGEAQVEPVAEPEIETPKEPSSRLSFTAGGEGGVELSHPGADEESSDEDSKEEHLDWGGFPSMDVTADQLGKIPRGEELKQYESGDGPALELAGEKSQEPSQEKSIEESQEKSQEPAEEAPMPAPEPFASGDPFGDDDPFSMGDPFGDDDPFSSGEPLAFDEPQPEPVSADSAEPAVTPSGLIPATPEPATSWAEKATVSVSNPFPAWASRLVEWDGDSLAQWLAKCPIDHLALALVGTDQSLISSLLDKLESQRKEAVVLQMEWGKLLPAEERENAAKQIESLLTR